MNPHYIEAELGRLTDDDEIPEPDDTGEYRPPIVTPPRGPDDDFDF